MLQAHPYADLFPMLDDDRLQELADSIKTNGQREPIWIYQGKILDGRNRYRACVMAGVTPVTRQYEGNNPIAFVLDLNLNRRHLSETQRADVAAKIANMRTGNPSFSNSANLLNCENTEENDDSGDEPDVSQADAAKMLNVSTRSVTAAKAVQKNGSKALQDLMTADLIKAGNAATLAKKYDHKTQDAVVSLIRGGMKFKDALAKATKADKPHEQNGKPKISGGTAFNPSELDRPVVKDKNGDPVPDSLRGIFVDLKDSLQERITEAQRVEAKTLEIALCKYSRTLAEVFTPITKGGKDTFEQGDLGMFRHKLRRSMPHALCPFCRGIDSEKCAIVDPVTGKQIKPCDSRGWMEKETFEKAKKLRS